MKAGPAHSLRRMVRAGDKAWLLVPLINMLGPGTPAVGAVLGCKNTLTLSSLIVGFHN